MFLTLSNFTRDAGRVGRGSTCPPLRLLSILVTAVLPKLKKTRALRLVTALGIEESDPYRDGRRVSVMEGPVGASSGRRALHVPHDPMRSRDASPSSVIGPSASVSGTFANIGGRPTDDPASHPGSRPRATPTPRLTSPFRWARVLETMAARTPKDHPKEHLSLSTERRLSRVVFTLSVQLFSCVPSPRFVNGLF